MNDQFGKNVSILLLIAAAALGVYSLTPGDAPTSRATPPAEIFAPNEQDVTARLWEDPLQAINADIAAKKSADVDWKRPPETLTNVSRSTNFQILLLSIPETPFPEDVEVRLRMRYAAQMALTSQDYSPDNGNALGYFTWNLSASRTLPVAYERFSRRGTSDPLLLLWLPEVILADSPDSALGVLAKLRSSLPKSKIFHFVGPRASDTLKSIIDTNKPHEVTALQKGFKIFSSAATAPDIFIDPTAASITSRLAIAEHIRRAITTNDLPPSTYFTPVIATDDDLTDKIVGELHLRGLTLAGTKKHPADEILVLAEADTWYGHSLPLAFEQSIAKSMRNSHPLPETRASIVKTYRYLRGLDQQKGTSQSLKGEERSIATSPEEALTKALNKTGPMAVGESQLDYAERLAQTASKGSARNFKAIGILGSDVYDKMILLRTLRQKFPDAVFFTTDLDARMWHPDYISFTRNLIVASSGDLEGSRTGDPNDARSNIPPFRDNYQAAVFDACLCALGALKTNEFVSLRAPKLFELGRSGPVPLTTKIPGKLPLELIALNLALVSIALLIAIFLLSQIKWKRDIAALFAAMEKWFFDKTPAWRFTALLLLLLSPIVAIILFAHPRVNNSFGFMSLASACFLAGAFGYTKATHGGVAQWAQDTGIRVLKDLRFNAAIILAVVLTLIFLQIHVISRLPGEEGFSWNSGTSAWPTEVVRLFVLTIALLAIAWAWARHVEAREEIQNRFHLKNESPPTQISFWPEFFRRLHSHQQVVAHLLTHPLWTRWPYFEGEKPKPAAIYQTYLTKARFRCRVARASLATALYIFLCMAIVFAIEGGPLVQTHIRGPLSIWFDRILTFFSATAFVFLIFYVMDAVCLTVRMLSCITECETAWSNTLKENTAAKFFVNGDDVPGYLDVQFAAAKSGEVGALIVLPLFMQFLFILARNPYFDNWSWPPTVIIIFTSNMLLAVSTWIKLRRVARQIRNEAVDELDEKIGRAQHMVDKDRNSPERPRLRALLRLRKTIENEKQGAYSRFIQDPTVVAMLVPSSAITILLILMQALFRR